MALAALALLTLCVPAPLAPQDLTDEQAVEAFVTVAKDQKAVPDLLVVGIEDLQARYLASADRMARAQDRLDAKEGKASEWKKILKHEADVQELLAEGVWASFRYRKKVTDQHMAVWRRAVTAFGEMGPNGADYLWEVFEDKRFSRDGAFRGRVVAQVGRTRDYDQAEKLIDLLDFHLEDVVIGVGQALEYYDKAPGKIRKECTEKLVRAVESYRSRGQGGESIDGPRIWGKVKRPLMDALKAVTGENYQTSLDWTKFWNDAKNDKSVWKDD